MTVEERENEIFNIQRLTKELSNRKDVFLNEYELFFTLTHRKYQPSKMEEWTDKELLHCTNKLCALSNYFYFNDNMKLVRCQ